MTKQESWLTLTQAAEHAKVSLSAVCKWISRHRIGVVGGHKTRLVQRKVLDAFLAEREPPPPPMGWLSVVEAAKVLGVTIQAVYLYRQKKKIVGRQDRYGRLLLKAESVAKYKQHRDQFVEGARSGFLSVRQTADYMQVTRGAVFALLRRGRLEATRSGRRLWIARKDVRGFLDAK
jgi:excisionase family DNA binding protein